MSIVLLSICAASFGHFSNSLEKNHLVQGILIEVFQHDSKVQQDLSRGEATLSAEEFADHAVKFAKEVLIYPFFMLLIALFLSLIGFFTVENHTSVAAGFLAMAGVFSLFTFVPAAFLFIAFKKSLEAERILTVPQNKGKFNAFIV